MNDTIQIRLTGEVDAIRAIYNRVCASGPRGPRGGLLHRCGLKERENGIAQLYADLPLAAFSGLFGGDAGAAGAHATASPRPLFEEAELLETAPAPALPGRYQVTFRRR